MARPDESLVLLVPAGRARRHLEQLAAQGIGYKTVCAAVGAAPQTVRNLLWPRRRKAGQGHAPVTGRIRPELEQKLLSFRPEMAAGGQRVDGTSFWEMYDELRSRGFYRGWIAEQIGAQSGNLRRSQFVTASRLRRMEALYAESRMKEPPAKRSRWKT